MIDNDNNLRLVEIARVVEADVRGGPAKVVSS
jgi:hypothetical protein